MNANAHVTIRIRGRVQGVLFRHAAKREAATLGITGFVRNEPDGSVYIEAEGKRDALRTFTDWCRKGPMFARVDSVEIRNGTIKHFPDFRAS